VGSLVGGADFLVWDLPGGLPLGNVLAALGLASAAAVAVLVGQAGQGVRRYGWGALAAATLWLPVSAALLGNWRLNGSPGASSAGWAAYTVLTVLFAGSALLWAGGVAWQRRRSGRTAPQSLPGGQE
jgi:hypothetical protein